jgi:hypothetical protein
MLGEYITIIFDEVKRRPRYLIGRQSLPADRDASRTANLHESVSFDLRP